MGETGLLGTRILVLCSDSHILSSLRRVFLLNWEVFSVQISSDDLSLYFVLLWSANFAPLSRFVVPPQDGDGRNHGRGGKPLGVRAPGGQLALVFPFLS